MKLICVLLLSLSAAGIALSDRPKHEDEDPENSIADVMKKAHGGKGLMKKVLKGEATDEELKELVSLYVDMMDNEPPKGSKEDWEAVSGKVVIAATRAMLGREGAEDLLKKATNCKNCHDAHKK